MALGRGRGATRVLAEVDDHRLPSGASTGAREFGTTDIIYLRGDEAAAAVRELTDGVGADAVLECVGTNDAMATAHQIARPGSTVGYVGVPHGIEIGGPEPVLPIVGIQGGPAPVRAYVPELLEDVLAGRINPDRVFDFETDLDPHRRRLRRDGRAAHRLPDGRHCRRPRREPGDGEDPMSGRQADELERLGRATETGIATRREDGSLCPYVTIWTVRASDDLCVRSAYGYDNRWVQRAIRSGSGRVRGGGVERGVRFVAPDREIADAISTAYHEKYDRYGASIVNTVVSAEAVRSTLRLEPT
jgi:hypothetical protein